MPGERSSLLRKQAHDFCNAVISGIAPADLLSAFFVPDQKQTNKRPKITEHGPVWATKCLPFLGQTFVGTQGCLSYFQRLSETLEFDSSMNTFPPPEGFVVDPDAQIFDEGKSTLEHSGVVAVEGRARFKSMRTGKAWDEQFMYRLSGFNEKGLFEHWEIWADPLSAWNAEVNDGDSNGRQESVYL